MTTNHVASRGCRGGYFPVKGLSMDWKIISLSNLSLFSNFLYKCYFSWAFRKKNIYSWSLETTAVTTLSANHTTHEGTSGQELNKVWDDDMNVDNILGDLNRVGCDHWSVRINTMSSVHRQWQWIKYFVDWTAKGRITSEPGRAEKAVIGYSRPLPARHGATCGHVLAAGTTNSQVDTLHSFKHIY